MIEGRACGKQPRNPLGVLPIDDLLQRPHFKQGTLVPISEAEFQHVQEKALARQFDTRKISLLGREPRCEQELLAAVVYGHEELGIERIMRVRKAFPDLFVKIRGHSQPVHLELEVYSGGFFSHGHDEHVDKRRFEEDGIPVALPCWIDNDEKVRRCVHRVYELQSLIREGEKIHW
jgi:hypothetical protein